MGYRIEYDGEVVRWKQEGMQLHRVVGYSLVCFLLFVVLTYFLWPGGWQTLEQVIYPGNSMVTKSALQNMAVNLRDGAPLGDAVVTFCQEIIENAQITG